MVSSPVPFNPTRHTVTRSSAQIERYYRSRDAQQDAVVPARAVVVLLVVVPVYAHNNTTGVLEGNFRLFEPSRIFLSLRARLVQG
jgi:hypothetical protein